MKAKYIRLGGITFAVLVLSAMTATDHLVPGKPVLAPLAGTRFCIRYPDDCKKTVGDGKDAVKLVTLTPERRAELNEVNARVNKNIFPQAQNTTAGTEKWMISPEAGDCGDYVVTKRHKLLARGWPSGTLLLTEVALRSGEHHLVLIARTNEGDLVLDNLKQTVRTVVEAELDYKWVRIESFDNPQFWNKVRERT